MEFNLYKYSGKQKNKKSKQEKQNNVDLNSLPSVGDYSLYSKSSSGLGDNDILGQLIANENMYEADNTYNTSEKSSNNNSSNVLDLIRLAETGSKSGNYGAYGDIGDGAGLSIGTYQFTEKSGLAQELAKRLGYNDIRDKNFKQILNTDIGKKAQDQLFYEKFQKPVESIAKQYGISDPKTIGFMVDTNLNGGLDSVLKRAQQKGGINLNNLIEARRDRYNYLISKNPQKFGQFRNGWMSRLNLWS
jgi:hypothetical protein